MAGWQAYDHHTTILILQILGSCLLTSPVLLKNSLDQLDQPVFLLLHLSIRTGAGHHARHLPPPVRRMQERQDPEGDVHDREEVPQAVERDGPGVWSPRRTETATTRLKTLFSETKHI